MNTSEEQRYLAYCRWCQGLGILPATKELWRSVNNGLEQMLATPEWRPGTGPGISFLGARGGGW